MTEWLDNLIAALDCCAAKTAYKFANYCALEEN